MPRNPLTELRSRLNDKTQRELAEELGIAESTLSQILGGTRGIPRQVLNALGYERIVTYRVRKADESRA